MAGMNQINSVRNVFKKEDIGSAADSWWNLIMAIVWDNFLKIICEEKNYSKHILEKLKSFIFFDNKCLQTGD